MVIIIGGGISGLAIGWYLQRASCDTTILERSEAGRGATWAAAGMLAPQVEAEPGEQLLLELLLESRDRWASFAAELEAAAGTPVDYRSEGTLVVAVDRDGAEQLRAQQRFARGLGLAVELISGYEARQLEPHLSRNVTAALLSRLDHQVDNRKVAQALRRAFLSAGGQLREHTAVDEILISAGRVSGVRLADETLAADTVIVAAGAWSQDIGGLLPDLRPPVRPVKGQMLALQMLPELPLLQLTVWGPGAYLVPRRDGRLLVGATVEEQGFNTQLTAGGLLDLLRGAWEALPAVYDLPVVESWAGLRPGSRDDAPILGPTPVDGLVMATGHYRNGILLAPITAHTISQLILEGRLCDTIKPFGLARFSERRSTP